MSHFRELVSKCMSTIKFIRRIVRLDPDPGNICLYGGPLHSGPLRIEMDPEGEGSVPGRVGSHQTSPCRGLQHLRSNRHTKIRSPVWCLGDIREGAHTIPYHTMYSIRLV